MMFLATTNMRIGVALDSPIPQAFVIVASSDPATRRFSNEEWWHMPSQGVWRNEHGQCLREDLAQSAAYEFQRVAAHELASALQRVASNG